MTLSRGVAIISPSVVSFETMVGGIWYSLVSLFISPKTVCSMRASNISGSSSEAIWYSLVGASSSSDFGSSCVVALL